MRCYVYYHRESARPERDQEAIQQYLKQSGLNPTESIHDDHSTRIHWGERPIGQIMKTIKANDHIVVYEAAYLACSTSQILEILSMAAYQRINLHFVKYALVVKNESSNIDTQHLLNIIGKIESDFVSKRTTLALARRRAAGLPLGRPKGRGNKVLKLDRHKEDIEKYMAIGISKASIAKLVACHPQTLYDWLERHKGRDYSQSHEKVMAHQERS